MVAPASALQLTREERSEIDRIVADGRTPQKLARRARIIALAADGMPNLQIAAQLNVSRPTVIAQRRRFQQMGLRGLVKDRTRPPGRRPLAAETVKKIVDATRGVTPANATQWTTRSMAEVAQVVRTDSEVR